MARSPKDIVLDVLNHASDRELVHRLVAPDATYVSLNDDPNPDLRRIMPWAGTSKGPDAVHGTFTRVMATWAEHAFDVEVALGEGEEVAVFGHVRFRSTVMGKEVRSPFSVLARVRGGGWCLCSSWRTHSRRRESALGGGVEVPQRPGGGGRWRSDGAAPASAQPTLHLLGCEWCSEACTAEDEDDGRS